MKTKDDYSLYVYGCSKRGTTPLTWDLAGVHDIIRTCGGIMTYIAACQWMVLKQPYKGPVSLVSIHHSQADANKKCLRLIKTEGLLSITLTPNKPTFYVAMAAFPEEFKA